MGSRTWLSLVSKPTAARDRHAAILRCGSLWGVPGQNGHRPSVARPGEVTGRVEMINEETPHTRGRRKDIVICATQLLRGGAEEGSGIRISF